MTRTQIEDRLADCPIIAAIPDTRFAEALASPAEIIFNLKANLLTIREQIAAAHQADKAVFVHLDLADGIGKDKTGIAFLSACGVDGIISTRGQLIRTAREMGLLSVQRFFTLDSQGVDSIEEQLRTLSPDFMEIMPGVISKTVARFAAGHIPVIAGGLIETKAEVTDVLGNGAIAVSTGKRELWYL